MNLKQITEKAIEKSTEVTSRIIAASDDMRDAEKSLQKAGIKIALEEQSHIEGDFVAWGMTDGGSWRLLHYNGVDWRPVVERPLLVRGAIYKDVKRLLEKLAGIG